MCMCMHVCMGAHVCMCVRVNTEIGTCPRVCWDMSWTVPGHVLDSMHWDESQTMLEHLDNAGTCPTCMFQYSWTCPTVLMFLCSGTCPT